MICGCVLGIAALLAAAPPAAAHSSSSWLDALDRADALMASTPSYTAVFRKTERIQETMVATETMQIKFMKPFSVYLEWLNPGGRSGEAIYVDGWNRNRVRVHPGGFWGILNFNLRTDSRWLTKNSRHPITQIGLDSLVNLIGSNVRRAIAATEFSSAEHGVVTMAGRAALALEGGFPFDPDRPYWCRRTLVYFDTATGAPFNIRNYDGENRLLEDYGYEDFRPDAALTAADFDPKNPAYRF